MKVFERDGKLNFVDDNNCVLGFDFDACCCEAFGAIVSRSFKQGRVDYGENSDYTVEYREGLSEDDLVGYQFDPDFFKSPNVDGVEGGCGEVFRATKDNNQIFILIYNSHNGYYSHGFSFDKGGVTLHNGSL